MSTRKRAVRIGSRRISEDTPPLVIADIGITNEGSMAKARRMIADAHAAGAECVKFQAHVVDDEMVPAARGVIPGNATQSIWNIMERCALTEAQDRALKAYAERLGMIYLSTPYSRAAADRLARLGVAAYKIGSGECNNYPLVEHIASFKKPVILSTGMNDISSIRPAVAILERRRVPYVLLHCVSRYPTPYEAVGLGALAELRHAFPGALVGLSDHSLGIYTALGATALGACVLEKHFTSDKTWPGPDVPLSLDPKELRDLIQGSKAIHAARGGVKRVLREEKPTIDFAYACVVAIRDIAKGHRYTADNIWVKRPGTGEIRAADFKKILGKKAKSDVAKDSQLRWEEVV